MSFNKKPQKYFWTFKILGLHFENEVVWRFIIDIFLKFDNLWGP